MKVVHDSYRGRVDSKNCIKELKTDFSVDSFVSHNFWATEACGNLIVLAYNFFSLFRPALVNSPKKSFLKTRSDFQGIRSALIFFDLPYKI